MIGIRKARTRLIIGAALANLLVIAAQPAAAQPVPSVIFEIDAGHHRVLIVDPGTTLTWYADGYTDSNSPTVPVNIADNVPCTKPQDMQQGKCLFTNDGKHFGTYDFEFCSQNLYRQPTAANCKVHLRGDFQVRLRDPGTGGDLNTPSSTGELGIPSLKNVYLELTTRKVKANGKGEVRHLLFSGDTIVWTDHNHKIRHTAFKKSEVDGTPSLNPCQANQEPLSKEIQDGPCQIKFLTSNFPSQTFHYKCSPDDNCDDPIVHVVNAPPPTPFVQPTPPVIDVILSVLTAVLLGVIVMYAVRRTRQRNRST